MFQELEYIIAGYLAVMSILGFILMGMDKRRAVKRAWRIPERTLLTVACLGGGIGASLGMYLLRHKTKHMKFAVILPLTAIIYFVVLLRVMYLGFN